MIVNIGKSVQVKILLLRLIFFKTLKFEIMAETGIVKYYSWCTYLECKIMLLHIALRIKAERTVHFRDLKNPWGSTEVVKLWITKFPETFMKCGDYCSGLKNAKTSIRHQS